MMKKLPIPGFVDLQVNGFGGADFSSPDLTADTFAAACRKLLDLGTAAFLPTVITSSLSLYERNLPLIANAIRSKEFRGRLLGIHLEGPFISREPGAVGAHNPKWVRKPDAKLLDRLFALADGTVRLITIAAELDGADKLARRAVKGGAAVSIGHSLATDADMARLVKAGATALTHLGNGLPNQLPRHQNPIWAGLANDSLTAMIITDGHHLPASVIKTMVRAKGAKHTVVVSDASPAAGLPPGHYNVLGNDAILERSGRLHNPAKKCLVGSSATMLQCMNHLASLQLLSFEELVTVGFINPLRVIGVGPSAVRSEAKLIWNNDAMAFVVQANPRATQDDNG